MLECLWGEYFGHSCVSGLFDSKYFLSVNVRLIYKIRIRKTLREEIPHHPNSRLSLISPVSLHLCLLLLLTPGSLSLAVFLLSKSFFLLYKLLVFSLAFHHPFLSHHIPSTSLSSVPALPLLVMSESIWKAISGKVAIETRSEDTVVTHEKGNKNRNRSLHYACTHFSVFL